MPDDGGSNGAPSVLALDDPTVVFDADHHVLAWNDAAASVSHCAGPIETGDPIEDVVGTVAARTIRNLVPLPDGTESAQGTTKLTTGTTQEYDVTVDRDDDRFVCILREATVDEARHRQLVERETVLESLPMPVYFLNTVSRFEYVNDALADLLDIPRDRFMDEHSNVEMGMPPEDIEHARHLTAELLSGDPETGDSTTFEMKAFTQNAGEVPCENNMAVLLEDGEFAGTVGTLRDIREQRRHEQRIKVLQRVLRHNLRTEVMIVDGHAELIEEITDDPTIVDAIERIRQACNRLVELGNRTQYVGEAIATHTEGDGQVLSDLVQKAVDDVRTDYPDVPIDVAVDDSLEVAAGRSLFRAIVELLRNAIVHNDAAEPRVEISSGTAVANTMLEFEGREEQVVVQIRDNGPGIPEHERRVVTGDGTESNLQHSDGLGLWMASWVIEAYGGQLSIRDADSSGTVVELSLPKPSG